MMETKAKTTQVLYPALRYADAPAAIRWLERAFGFERQEVCEGNDGTVAHAELALEGGVLMLGSARDGGPYPAKTPPQAGAVTGTIYAYVSDPDAHCARARDAGARIAIEPRDTDYGSREYAAVDCEEHWWSFGTYRP
jgi:uncharacterized glyoxalase superfamily protein PhnB